jgi:hypothetical protein
MGELCRLQWGYFDVAYGFLAWFPHTLTNFSLSLSRLLIVIIGQVFRVGDESSNRKHPTIHVNGRGNIISISCATPIHTPPSLPPPASSSRNKINRTIHHSGALTKEKCAQVRILYIGKIGLEYRERAGMYRFQGARLEDIIDWESFRRG